MTTSLDCAVLISIVEHALMQLQRFREHAVQIWSKLMPDGKIKDCPVKIVLKSLLETKLRLEGKWRPDLKGLKKPELLAEVLKLCRSN